MDLFQNPFHILAATTRENRRRIMELSDERSLLLDSSECMQARSDLTNPRKRLSAEIAWLPGIGPKRVGEVLSLLESSPSDLLGMDKLASIAQANLLAAGLSRLPDYRSDDVAEWTLEIAWAFEDIDTEELCAIINEERIVSGFPEVTDLSAVEAEIQERRRHYRQVIKSALDHLSAKELVEAVTVAVESATDDGEKHGPILIADLVDSYEVEAQAFLEKEEGNIKALVEKLRSAVDAERPDSTLAPMINQLIQVVKNWDTVAQPIQVSTKSRGLDHDASHRVAGLVRGLVIHMFNEHGKLDFSQQLTKMLQEVFAEVGEVVERTAEDAIALDEIAEQRIRLIEDAKNQKRGFSDLSDLASEVSGADDAVSSEPTSEAKPSSGTQAPPSTPKETPRSEEEEQELREDAKKAQVDSGKRRRRAILGGVALCFLVIFTISYQAQLLEEKKLATTQAEARAMAEKRALEEASAKRKLANEAEYIAKQQAAEAERRLKLTPQLSEQQSLASQDLSSSIGQEEYVDGFKLFHLTDLDSKDYLNYIDRESIVLNGSKVRWVAVAVPKDKSMPRYRSIREGDCQGDWNQITESAKKQPEESEYSHIGGTQPVSSRVAEEEKTIVCQISDLNRSSPITGM
jgi:hypothetical protein